MRTAVEGLMMRAVDVNLTSGYGQWVGGFLHLCGGLSVHV